MKQKRVLAPLLPGIIGLVLLAWGLKVMYTSFMYGTLPTAGWQTEDNEHFGMIWFIAFFVVLLPAYAYAISRGVQCLQKKNDELPKTQRGHWLGAGAVTILLCVLTFCTRVAVTAWFPSPMHVPFQAWKGGLVSGLTATMILLVVEAGVLAGIKHQTRREQKPFPLLIPGFFALVLLAWAGWISYTAFKDGALPVVGWQTEHRRLFGLAWLMAFCVVLLPAYLYAVGLGILGLVERGTKAGPISQNFWLVAVGITALLCLLTFCTRVAVTAWFPGPMHAPLDNFTGGNLAGVIATLVLGLVVVTFYRVARSF